ncbi:MAG: hypothetical protein MHMPM18_001440 [Marteilia pararefringens]
MSATDSILNFIVDANFSSRDLTGTFFFDTMKDFIRARRLALNDCSIRFLPQEVASMKNLEELSVKRNKIVNFKIDFSQLSNLKVLLSSNNLLYDAAFPESLYKCYWLIVLDLSANLFSQIPKRIGKLFGLSLLNFSNNINITIEWDILSKCMFLRFLILKNCKLSSIPESIKSLSALTGLDISDNKIFSNNLDNIRHLKGLKYLYLNNIDCDEHALDGVCSKLVNLKELYMHNNRVTQLSDQMCMLKKLKILDLSDNHIRKISSLIDCFFRLEILILSGNELTKLDPNITNMPMLRRLYINANELTFENLPKNFDDLTNLELLDLSANQLHILPTSLTRCLSLKTLKVQYMSMTEFPSFSMIPDLKIHYEGNDFVKKIEGHKKYEKLSQIHITLNLETELKKNGIKLKDIEKKNSKSQEHLEDIQRRLFKSKHNKNLNFLESLAIQNEPVSGEMLKALHQDSAFGNDGDNRFQFQRSTKDYRNSDLTNNLFERAKHITEGYLVWYIDSFQPKYLDYSQYGKLFLKETLIILHAFMDDNGNTERKIYVWRGENSPRDKCTAASLMALSLKNSIEYSGKIYHEDCYSESPDFQGIFDYDLNYVDECITDSSLKKASEVATKPARIFKILTDKYHRIVPVSPKSKMPTSPSSSFFVVHDSSGLICWCGAKTSLIQRRQVSTILYSWYQFDNKSGSPPVTACQDSPETEEMKRFMQIKDSIPKEEFFIDAKLDESYNCLFKIDLDTESGIKISIENIEKGFYPRSVLDPKYVYILDTSSDCFLWVGLLSSFYLRVASFSVLDSLFDIYPKPEYSESKIVWENSESFLFNQYFIDDRKRQVSKELSPKQYTFVSHDLFIPRASESTKEEFENDSKNMDETLTFMQIFVFDASKGQYVALPEDEYGLFYDENTYFVVTTFDMPIKDSEETEKHMMTFIWKGKHASKKGIFDFNFEWKPKLVLEFKGNMKFIFLEDQRETKLFLMLFNRIFIVLCGKKCDLNEFNEESGEQQIVFETRSSAGYSHIRCAQIHVHQLLSNFVYIIVDKNETRGIKIFVWKGIFSKTDDYRDSQSMAERISMVSADKFLDTYFLIAPCRYKKQFSLI